MTYGHGNNWYARGGVCIVEASGHTIEIERFESREAFKSKEEAEAHGLKLARDWVDCGKD